LLRRREREPHVRPTPDSRPNRPIIGGTGREDLLWNVNRERIGKSVWCGFAAHFARIGSTDLVGTVLLQDDVDAAE
jgi:hypothetical protein